MNEGIKDRLVNLWVKSTPKKKTDRRSKPRKTKQGPPGEDRAYGEEVTDLARAGQETAAAAKGGGQTPGSKAVDWANRLINRNKKIGPLM